MENNHRLEKDIILICKGRYNKEKYKTFEDAFTAYYKKYYDEFKKDNLSESDILYIFIKPTLKLNYILNKNNQNYGFINKLFDLSMYEKLIQYRLKENEDMSFNHILYNRITEYISELRTKEEDGTIIFDFSEYPLDDKYWEGVI